MTGIAGFAIRQLPFAVDGLCQDPGTSGLTYTTRTAKQKSVGELVIADGIFQGSGNVFLSHHRIERLGSVLPR